MKRCLLIFVLLLLLYVGSYAWYRSAHIRRWEVDGRNYIVFQLNQRTLHFLYRPLSYLDAKLTGAHTVIRAHFP